MSYGGPDPRGSDYRTCEHEWQPVSFRFENQLLTDRGQVVVRQPDPSEGRCYIVCLLCASHTYMSTKMIYRLYGSEDQNEDGTWINEDDGNEEAWQS
jgi:hypothetical protein